MQCKWEHQVCRCAIVKTNTLNFKNTVKNLAFEERKYAQFMFLLNIDVLLFEINVL